MSMFVFATVDLIEIFDLIFQTSRGSSHWSQRCTYWQQYHDLECCDIWVCTDCSFQKNIVWQLILFKMPDIIFSLSSHSRPHDTPFEDGTFKLTIEFTEEYPNKPPTVRFVSKMFHPNVYADGGICLDILQNRWSPTYDVSAILTSIQVSTDVAFFFIWCGRKAFLIQ